MKDRTQYLKEYRLKNKKKLLKLHRQYNQLHREEIIEKSRQYSIKYREQENERKRQWHKDNPEYDRHWRKNNPEKMKVINSRKKAKRRQLGYFPLNTPFEGSIGHHISENFVIYIPKRINQNIRHNIWTWYNMDKINRLAFGYL